MKGYVLGRDAEQDLYDLWEYIAQDSVEAADHLIKQFFDAFESLALNSGQGHKREDLTQLPVLFWPLGNYLIIYRVAKSHIDVVAIVHGKRDVPVFLRRSDNR
ncbi:MAG TPA: type II toxin-antitoxin system RelE/ParE family toxin [Phycisphaerae bacterium]|nr:type II toxin-antitoxin system RelE/ParE family toxin [Phycisphaerae bacterium]